MLSTRKLRGYEMARKRSEPEANASNKFAEMARDLGCDMTQEEFAKKLKGIGSVKPMTNAEVQKKVKHKAKR
jgi:hypothetical protein